MARLGAEAGRPEQVVMVLHLRQRTGILRLEVVRRARAIRRRPLGAPSPLQALFRSTFHLFNPLPKTPGQTTLRIRGHRRIIQPRGRLYRTRIRMDLRTGQTAVLLVLSPPTILEQHLEGPRSCNSQPLGNARQSLVDIVVDAR